MVCYQRGLPRLIFFGALKILLLGLYAKCFCGSKILFLFTIENNPYAVTGGRLFLSLILLINRNILEKPFFTKKQPKVSQNGLRYSESRTLVRVFNFESHQIWKNICEKRESCVDFISQLVFVESGSIMSRQILSSILDASSS